VSAVQTTNLEGHLCGLVWNLLESPKTCWTPIVDKGERWEEKGGNVDLYAQFKTEIEGKTGIRGTAIGSQAEKKKSLLLFTGLCDTRVHFSRYPTSAEVWQLAIPCSITCKETLAIMAGTPNIIKDVTA
jgi:hypothetical protein